MKKIKSMSFVRKLMLVGIYFLVKDNAYDKKILERIDLNKSKSLEERLARALILGAMKTTTDFPAKLSS